MTAHFTFFFFIKILFIYQFTLRCAVHLVKQLQPSPHPLPQYRVHTFQCIFC